MTGTWICNWKNPYRDQLRVVKLIHQRILCPDSNWSNLRARLRGQRYADHTSGPTWILRYWHKQNRPTDKSETKEDQPSITITRFPNSHQRTAISMHWKYYEPGACGILTSFHVLVLLALRALSTAPWYSLRWTKVMASLAKLDTLLYKSLAASNISSSKHRSPIWREIQAFKNREEMNNVIQENGPWTW